MFYFELISTSLKNCLSKWYLKVECIFNSRQLSWWLSLLWKLYQVHIFRSKTINRNNVERARLNGKWSEIGPAVNVLIKRSEISSESRKRTTKCPFETIFGGWKLQPDGELSVPEMTLLHFAFPRTFHLAHPWKSLYIERNRTAFRRTSKSHSTASLILLRSFRRGVRAYCTSPLYRCMNVAAATRKPSDILITIHRWLERLARQSATGGNCTKDEVALRRRWFSTHSLSLSLSLARPATWCNCANEPRQPASWKTEPRNNLDPG